MYLPLNPQRIISLNGQREGLCARMTIVYFSAYATCLIKNIVLVELGFRNLSIDCNIGISLPEAFMLATFAMCVNIRNRDYARTFCCLYIGELVSCGLYLIQYYSVIRKMGIELCNLDTAMWAGVYGFAGGVFGSLVSRV